MKKSTFNLAGFFLKILGIMALALSVLGGLAYAQALPSELEPEGDIFLSRRHIVILNADLENIWGSYFFAVHNKTTASLPFKTEVMMPKEVVDFRAQDGLTDADLKLGRDGQLMLEKEFPPGLSLLGVGFQVKVRSYGDDYITFEPPVDVGEFSIAVPKNSDLQLEASALDKGVPPMLAGGQYDGLMSQDGLARGSSVQVAVKGLPKERASFWIIGIIAGLALVLLACILAMKTKPDNPGQYAEDLTI